ncbi:MAG: YciC family protein [Bacteroidota bacterium]
METAIRKNNDQIIKEAREAFKGQWGNVFLAFLLSTLVSAAIGLGVSLIMAVIYNVLDFFFRNRLMELFTVILIIIGVILWLVFQGRFWIWQNNYILRKSRGENVSYSDFKSIFEGFKNINEIKASLLNKDQLLNNLLPAILLLLTTLSILLGYVLLIIPGIIVSFMLALVPFIAAEENNINPIDAMKKSADMMDGYKMKLFWCYVKLIPLAILCALPCGLGLFWFGPYMSFVLAKFYDAHK